MPAFVAANSAKENGNIVFRGQNLFASLKYFLEEKIKSKDVSSDLKKKTESLLKRFLEYAEEHGMDLDYKSQVTKNRDKKVVCKTLHGAGIVVPVDENEVGYRPVPETPADLRKMLRKIAESKTDKERDKNFEPLQELITYIQFANDECDYGEGLELGLDLFTHGGSVFHTTILSLLPLAYQLLRRDEYSKIIEAHIKKRRHIADLSELV
ncbi:histone PARylation factor 1 [Patella vulgata]|uniref:histone PARylation factor 1 n=1 Tax=Patella vulgata TaxID=6465 RepID=UPI0024A96926|nr:histone PARylation factor 1 [Patella vulgata]